MQVFEWKRISWHYILLVMHFKQLLTGIEACLHPEVKPAYEFLLSHLSEYRQFIGVAHLREHFGVTNPEYLWLNDVGFEETAKWLRYWAVHYAAQGLQNLIQRTLVTATKTCDYTGFLSAVEEFHQAAGSVITAEAVKFSDATTIINQYLQNPELKVCNYGFPTLDALTGGITAAQFILLYAQTSQGKSTFARALAVNIAYQGKKVLYITLEEGAEKSVMKSYALATQTNQNEILNNNPSGASIQKLAQFQRPTGDIIFDTSCRTVLQLSAMVLKHSPDVIIIDQLSLFNPTGDLDWKVMGKISGQVKNFAMNTKIPIIGLSQAVRKTNKKNPTVEDDVAFAIKMAQDADAAIYLHPDEYLPVSGETVKKIQLVKNRDNERNKQIELLWDLKTSTIREYDGVLSNARI